MPPTRRRGGGRGSDDAHEGKAEAFLLVFSHGDMAPQPPQSNEKVPPGVPVTRRRGRVRYDLRRGRGDTGETR